MKEVIRAQKMNLYKTIIFTLIFSILFLSISYKITLEFRKNEIQIEHRINSDKKLFGRILDFKDDTEKICNKSDENLQNYYKTGDENLLDLSSVKKGSNDSLSEPIQAIVDIINDKGEMNNNIIHFIKHLIPIAIFIVVGILSIPGWIICCISCCCNCCCCCCCKFSCCKLPCFIVAIVFYIVALASCFYGLTKSGKIFTGISNIECGVMKFINEVDEGETKNVTGKWVGFTGIEDFFNEIKNTVNSMKADTLIKLNASKVEEEKEKKKLK